MTPPIRRPKEVWSSRMDPELLDKARAVAFWTPGLTLSSLVDLALRDYLERWVEKHGEPDTRTAPLREGRPLTIRDMKTVLKATQ